MIDLRFTYATVADVPRLAALIELAYRGTEAAAGWTNETDILEGPRSSPGEVEQLIRDPNSRFVLTSHGGKLVGSALLKKHGDGAYFGMFAIDPSLQQQGLGKVVIARCETAVQELWDAKFLELTVISLRHELIAWYQRRGYRSVGRWRWDVTNYESVVLSKILPGSRDPAAAQPPMQRT